MYSLSRHRSWGQVAPAYVDLTSSWSGVACYFHQYQNRPVVLLPPHILSIEACYTLAWAWVRIMALIELLAMCGCWSFLLDLRRWWLLVVSALSPLLLLARETVFLHLDAVRDSKRAQQARLNITTYINATWTVVFVILFLPSEGLYAKVLRLLDIKYPSKVHSILAFRP